MAKQNREIVVLLKPRQEFEIDKIVEERNPQGILTTPYALTTTGGTTWYLRRVEVYHHFTDTIYLVGYGADDLTKAETKAIINFDLRRTERTVKILQ